MTQSRFLKPRFAWLLTGGIALTTAACGDEDPGIDPDVDASAEPDASEPATQPVEIAFAARFGDDDAACGETYEGVGAADTTIEITDLRFYVSGIHLISEDGDEVPVELDQESDWQYEDVALLDFEDGSASCSEFGNPEMNDVVVGEVAEGEYVGIRFDVGLPFEHNHLDVDAAPSPLNIHALQWNWRAGYIFLKLDMLNDNDPPDDRWIVHLGSTGCDSGSPLEPPSLPCENPNRPTITLEDFAPDADTIVLDLEALLADTNLEENSEDSGTGCQSFAEDEAECEPIFANLGLSFATGHCDGGCEGQTAFRVE